MTIIQDSPSNYIQIQPIVINSITNKTVTRLYISSIFNNLNSQAIFSCILTDENKNELYNTQVILEGIDYTNWTGDNQTPFTYVLSKLSFTVSGN